MKTAVAFGTFDGIHAGHRAVLEATAGYNRAAVTFSVPPKFIKNGGGQLMMLEDRLKYLKEIGMDEIECLKFERFKDMSPLEFLRFITERFDVGLISCGYNFRFGKDAVGDTEFLEKYCDENGIEFACSKPVKEDGKIVSSSLIRDYIKNGDTEKANKLLYHPFGYTAKVLKGDMRGRTIGFPTVNQYIPSPLETPKCGVYKSETVVDGKRYKSITDIGIRPTYKTERIISETHIIGFSGDIYGKEITVYPQKFIREERKFGSLEELKNAIQNDYEEAIKL